MPNPDLMIAHIRTTLRWLVAATVALYLVLFALSAYTWETSRTNGHALCLLRADLVRRVLSSEQVLITHPHGLLGFSPAAIQGQINGEKRTIHALAGLSCQGP